MSKTRNDTPDFHRGCHCLSVVPLGGFLLFASSGYKASIILIRQVQRHHLASRD